MYGAGVDYSALHIVVMAVACVYEVGRERIVYYIAGIVVICRPREGRLILYCLFFLRFAPRMAKLACLYACMND